MIKLKKQLHLIAAYLLVLLFTGYAVYADPEKPEDEAVVSETASTEEAGGAGEPSEEDDPEIPSSDTSATEKTSTEESSTEKPSTENPSTEKQSTETSSTEKVTEASSDTEETETSKASETGSEGDSEDLTEEDPELTSEIEIMVIASYYSMEDILKMREAYSERQSEVKNAEDGLARLRSRQNDYITNMQQMDDMIIDLQGKIEQLDTDKEKAAEAVARLNYELALTKDKEKEQYERLKEHIRNSYENGNYSYVDALLNAKSFTELLNKPEYVQQVSKYDEKLLKDFKDTSTRIADQKLLIEVLTDGAGTLQNAYQDQQNALVLMTEAKQDEILKYQASIDNQSEELEKLKVLEQEQAARLAEMENPQFTTVTYKIKPYSGGTFVWPQPSSFRITSDFGWRGDIGVPGATRYHQGIDISANMYDPVIAAAPGTVTFVGYYGTGGKTVMIDIGSTITIIYHHLNDYAVELGDHVEAGTVVGRVGMTGATSGPHLHFSVRVNGTYVNPRPYLGLPMPIKQQVPEDPRKTSEDGENTGTSTEENSEENSEQGLDLD